MRWSRRPPLRFNEVALPAGAAVSQVGLARGGGWARLSYTVSAPSKLGASFGVKVPSG